MKPTEAVALVAATEQLWPGEPIAEFTPDAWGKVLADVPLELAQRAVLELAQLGGRRPNAGQVRRHCALLAGLMAPDEDEAWRQASDVASAGGAGRLALPEPVREAYDAVGGAHAWVTIGAATLRAQFRDMYRPARDRADRGTLTADLRQPLALATTTQQPRGLTA